MAKIITIFGTIVVFALTAGIIIVIMELIWYRIRCVAQKNRPEKRISVITGASSGLGGQYALRLDKILPEEEEIWLVARREDRLWQLAEQLHHSSKCLVYDLTDPVSTQEIAALVEQEGVMIRYLVNCAGYGKIGKISEMPRTDQSGMIDLNCTAGVNLTSVCMPYLERGSHIINVCSTAGFQSFQNLNIYAATKAFFLRYTRALRMELLSAGIVVTAVCPYWIKDTEFIGIAGQEKKSDIRSFPLASKVSSVAAVSLFGSRIGLPVVTPGIVCTFHRLFSKLFPDTVLGYIWEGLRRL